LHGLRLANQVAGHAIETGQEHDECILCLFLAALQPVSQASTRLHRCLRRRIHQKHSPLQSGLGRFEQLAEHL
jgi:hypothetical protein